MKSEFGKEYLLIFIGYTVDANEAAEVIVGLEQPLQRELDKLRKVNPYVPFNRVKLWKWDSDASPIKGGQESVITPNLERANIAVFVFHERIGTVAWQELNYAIEKKPAIAVLPFFKATSPSQENMNREEVAEQWLDLLKKQKLLASGWTDPESNAITPLPKYNDTIHLGKLAIDRLITEVVRLSSIYSTEIELEKEKKRHFETKINIDRHVAQIILGRYVANNEPFIYSGFGNILSIVPAGKSRYTSTVIPQVLNFNGATLILDPTGEIYKNTIESKSHSTDILKLDPWNIAGDSITGSLNPVDIILQLGFSVNDTAKFITELMIPFTEYHYRRKEALTSDPFWVNQERKFLTALIHLAISESENNEGIFSKVHNILHEDDVVYNLAVRLDTKGKDMDPELRKSLAFFLQQPDNTRSGILAGVSQFVMALSSSIAQLLTNTSSVDIKKWINGEPVTIYLIGPPAGIAAFDSIYRSWLGSLLLPILIKNPTKENPVLLVFDIDETFEQWNGIVNAMTMGRNIQVWVIVSDISDIERAFRDNPNSVLHSFSVIQTFRANNFSAIDKLSKFLGITNETILELLDDNVLVSLNGTAPIILTKFDL